MKQFTEFELWCFVGRADSHEKIEIAIQFLSRLDYLPVQVFDDMMNALAFNH